MKINKMDDEIETLVKLKYKFLPTDILFTLEMLYELYPNEVVGFVVIKYRNLYKGIGGQNQKLINEILIEELCEYEQRRN